MHDIIAVLANGIGFVSETYPGIWIFDTARYLIGAGSVYVIVNIALAHALRNRKIRERSPDWTQKRREILASLRTAAIFAGVGGLSIAGLMAAGFDVVYGDPLARGWPYLIFSTVMLIVLHDAWFYWTHRLIHCPKLFRRFHREHHKSHNPSPWAAYSFDPGEAVVNAIYLPLVLLFIPSAGLAIFIFINHMMIRNAIGHSGYELFPSARNGRPMFDWMTSVTHHDLHHAQAGWNYGLYFSWWDRLMGTEHPLYHEKFAEAVRKPLDGSAIQARKNPLAHTLAAVGFLVVSSSCVLETATVSMQQTLGRAHDMIDVLAQAAPDKAAHQIMQAQ